MHKTRADILKNPCNATILLALSLCTDKKKAVVEYALGGINNKIFASKCKLRLPDPEILKSEIEHKRKRLFEMNIIKKHKE